MATTSFRIQRISLTTTPSEHPMYVWPTTFASPFVQYPRPTRSNGNNQPAGIVGLPFCVFGREKISKDGMSFYNALFTSSADEYVRVKAQLYNPRSGEWEIYKGTLWRPEFKESVAGMAYGFREFKATIIDLVKIANWNVVAT